MGAGDLSMPDGGRGACGAGRSDWWPRNGVIAGLDVFGESYDYPISGEKATSKTPHVVDRGLSRQREDTGADVDAVKVADTLDQEPGSEWRGQREQGCAV